MSKAALQQEPELPVPLAALFTAFFTVSLCGFGGGIVWARRIAVEQRQWINEEEFADIVSLCQFMPGPNIVGIAVCMGAKLRGFSGVFAAVSGFVPIPWAIGFVLGALYFRNRPPLLSYKTFWVGFNRGSRAAHRDGDREC